MSRQKCCVIFLLVMCLIAEMLEAFGGKKDYAFQLSAVCLFYWISCQSYSKRFSICITLCFLMLLVAGHICNRIFLLTEN